MKKLFSFILLLVICFSACKKNNEENKKWSDEEKASYNNVVNLQKQAAINYHTWIKTMDSLEVINKMKEFFLSDPSVQSATICSQGISVKYKNGMGGGLFLDPEDDPHMKLKLKAIHKACYTPSQPEHLVNRRNAILINPHYNDRYELTDKLIAMYDTALPKAGFNPLMYYVNDEADVDLFTKLSGYGIIHVYTHGFAWPSKYELKDVYIMTGEDENIETGEKYWKELRNEDILVVGHVSGDDPSQIDDPVYFLSEKFITEHNDFSKDTLLFYGGFCYGGLGQWGNLPKSMAAGAYFGADWSVETTWNCNWATNLINFMTDTTHSPQNPGEWMSSFVMDKEYWSEEFQRNVKILYYGDDNLALWERYPVIGKYSNGGIVFYIDTVKRVAYACAPTDCQPAWPFVPWGCLGTKIGASGTEIGTGNDNTLLIMAACPTSAAKAFCDGVTVNGYRDWFIPSKDELNELFKQRAFIGMSANYYLSSSEWAEEPQNSFWRLQMIDHAGKLPGTWEPDYKSYDYSATRLIRWFSF
jgi:hypothetical protein